MPRWRDQTFSCCLAHFVKVYQSKQRHQITRSKDIFVYLLRKIVSLRVTALPHSLGKSVCLILVLVVDVEVQANKEDACDEERDEGQEDELLKESLFL